MGNRLRKSFAAKAALVLCLAALVIPASPVVGSTAQETVDRAPAVHEETHELKVDRRTVVAATAPPQVAAGQKITITGVAQVRGGRAAKARPVKLLERKGRKWIKVGKRKTNRIGDFTFRVAAKKSDGVRVFKVKIRRFKGLRAGSTSVFRVEVVRTAVNVAAPAVVPPLDVTPAGSYDPAEPIPANEPTPQGVSTDWTWLYTNGGGRWNPCAVIDWGYYPGRGYGGAVNDVKTAFAKISARTGLRFRYAGTVNVAPGPGMTAVPGVDIVVGWSDYRQISQLAGSVVGLASAIATSTSGADVPWKLQRGWVALDADGVLRQGYDVSGWPTWGQVMVHEGLHALGLGHAGAQTQVMYGAVNSVNHRFGAGDLGGMSRIGSAYGCLN